ncbi:MAG: polysaccharide biosynthesis C-terminal domain-containing protein, partial [Planctomycetes bacterium]|nr:polysaccharide biosynthesis C-terminal domain-containing protein [Planctomycetota bacterium]
IATAIFPQLAKLAHRKDRDAFAKTLGRGVRLALFVGLPASVGLFAVRWPLVRVLYERGEFTAADTIRVAQVVGWYGLGVWAYITQQVLVRGYYSLGNTRTPMRIAGAVVFLNLGLNLLLVQRYAESGIAAATAVSAAIQVVLLAAMFAGTGQAFFWRPLSVTAGKALAASILMFLAIWAADVALGPQGGALAREIGRLVLEVALGAIVFVLAARLLRCEELGYLVGR